VEEPNTSGKGCSDYGNPQRTEKATACWAPVQDAARVLTARSFDFSPQGGGGEEPEKDAKIDAEAVSEGTCEPDETMPEPEEPAGIKPGLQGLSGTKNGSPGGRQTQSETDALLRVDESGVGKSKSSVELPKGFEELLSTDPQYQRIQGFSFGDFPPQGGEVSKDTTSNMTIGAKEAPSRDIENVKALEKETELEGKVAPDPKGKAKERRQALRSRSVARLPSANPNSALRTWPRVTPQSSGVSRPPRVREKTGCTMNPMGTDLKSCKPSIGVRVFRWCWGVL
jgi:hypothetical protein